MRLSNKNVQLAGLVSNFNIQRVLVAPLDWGLGHATRCIPIVKALLHNGFEVLLAAEGKQKTLLEKEFPSLQILPLKGYGISYSKCKSLLPLKMLMQVPKILRAIKHEHDWLDKAIDEHKIDLVISDNRYGLNSKKVPCVFITHQLVVKAPVAWLEKKMQSINYKYINQFRACWVPDLKGEKNIAGVLSHPSKMPKVPVHYLGLLSRFDKVDVVDEKYSCCILLSGPEPQRTLLEDEVLKGIHQLQGNILLVRGKPGSDESLQVPNNVSVKNHLSGSELQQAIQQSNIVISRSGYTTVMELLSLQKKSMLIPTPGQTEQEYLAERLHQQGWCYAVQQDDFSSSKAVEAAAFNYTFPSFESSDLPSLIPQLIKQLQ